MLMPGYCLTCPFVKIKQGEACTQWKKCIFYESALESDTYWIETDQFKKEEKKNGSKRQTSETNE